MKWKIALLFVLIAALGLGASAENLFEEAGHDLGKSRWVMIRFLPAIQIALEADDVVLIESVEHPPKGLAMRIDGDALAADCAVTETKDTEYTTVSSDDKTKWSSGSTSTTTTYWASCEFPAGTTEKATGAHEIVVQVAMTNGTTKPHQLKSKELRKFQDLRK